MGIQRSHHALWMGAVLFAACASDSASHEDDLTVAVNQEGLVLSRDCRDSLEDVYTQPNLGKGNQGKGRRGDIVRCAQGRVISRNEIASSLANRGFAEVTAKFAVQLLRISYRTERQNGQADVSTAILLLPTLVGRFNVQGADVSATQSSDTQGLDTQPTSAPSPDARTASGQNGGAAAEDLFAGGGGKRVPLIVFAHGTVPYGSTCAYSRNDPTNDPFQPFGVDTELGSLLAFATRGYPVIMPDYAGFTTGSTVAGYLMSGDEAKSLLDATRVSLFRRPQDQVVFVGHSQGGHAVLSAQALARSYGMSGQLLGVAAMAPFWAPARLLGALIAAESDLNTTDNFNEFSFAIEYFYTHAEQYDGRGKGAALFTPSAQANLNKYVSSCTFFEDPAQLGAKATDIFEPTFQNAVGHCGLFGGSECSEGLAATWEARFKADRPTLDRNGAPIVMWHGAKDAVIAPPYAKCAIDKIRADVGNKFTFCGDAQADHETLLAGRAAWVMRWIEARRSGGAVPACDGESALGAGLVCPEPTGNVD